MAGAPFSRRTAATLLMITAVLASGCGRNPEVRTTGRAESTGPVSTTETSEPERHPEPACKVLDAGEVQAITGEPTEFSMGDNGPTDCVYSSRIWTVTVTRNSTGPVNPSVGDGTPDPAVPAPNRVRTSLTRGGTYAADGYVVAGGEGWLVSVYNDTLGSDTYPPRPGHPAQQPATQAAISGLLTRIVEVLG